VGADGRATSSAQRYKITVYTSDIKWAGTDANVTLELRGEKSNSGLRKLASSKNDFERGEEDTSSHSTTPNRPGLGMSYGTSPSALAYRHRKHPCLKRQPRQHADARGAQRIASSLSAPRCHRRVFHRGA
jgi:hypothetical protein